MHLDLKDDVLVCTNCKTKYQIENGVPILLEKSSGKHIVKESHSLVEKIKSEVKNNVAVYKFARWAISPSTNLESSYKSLIFRHSMILDVGAGSVKHDPKIVNMDIVKYPNVDVVGDAHRLPFIANSYDLIIMKTMLEHSSNPNAIVDEVYRVLKKGGNVYASVPFMFHFHEAPDDYYRWTKSGLKVLFSKFKKVKIGVNSGPTSTFIMIFSDYLALLLSFNSQFVYSALSKLFTFMLKPLKMLDYLVGRNKNSIDLASIIYIVAEK